MKHASRGAALAVTLVLLTGLAVLALAAAATAVTALALTGHQQGAAEALEAAEAGIAEALEAAREQPGPRHAGPMQHTVAGTTQARFETETTGIAGQGTLPPGFSIGTTDGTFQAQHYLIVSTSQATRNTRLTLEQGFYVVVPHQ
ncbi:MAG: PilX N-terminal domain-containing pilus assembly protein [Steroidobacteraceae bacterium]